MKISLDKRLEVLTQQIVRARIYYDLWWFSVGEQTKLEIVDTLNDYPEFFVFDTHAHFVGMIVHSAVVWDRKNGTISLPRLADDILDPKRHKDHASLAAQIKDNEKKASGIKKIRNKAIAHRNEVDDYATVFKDAKIIPDELPIMMDSWLILVSELRRINGVKSDKVTGEPDFNNLPLLNMQKLIHKLGGPDLRPKSSLDQLLES